MDDEKAVRYVLNGQVKLTGYTWQGDAILDASGIVQGTAEYETRWAVDHVACTCPYGQHHPDSPHSHTTAVYLAARQALVGKETI